MNICVWYFSLGNILFSNRHWYIYLYLGPFKVMDYWFLDSLIYLEHTDTVKVLMLCGKHLYSLSHLPSLLFFKKKKKSDTLFFFKTGFKSQASTCLCLPRAGIRGMDHHCPASDNTLKFYKWNSIFCRIPSHRA